MIPIKTPSRIQITSLLDEDALVHDVRADHVLDALAQRRHPMPHEVVVDECHAGPGRDGERAARLVVDGRARAAVALVEVEEERREGALDARLPDEAAVRVRVEEVARLRVLEEPQALVQSLQAPEAPRPPRRRQPLP